MKIQYCSDLHLEFPENKKFLKEKPLTPLGDILLLAGDVVLFNKINEHKDFFDFVSENFKYTFWVPGNHEYYYIDMINKTGTFKEAIKDNVFIVNNISEKIDDITLIFSTLWTKIDPAKSFVVQQGLNDFYLIDYDKNVLTPDIYNTLYKQSLEFISGALKNKNEKTVVLTHHVPTFYHYPNEYKNSVLNSAFAVELYDFIKQSQVDYWIYGHTHYNTPPFTIGKTKLITNQLGYVFQGEHKTFDRNKMVEL